MDAATSQSQTGHLTTDRSAIQSGMSNQVPVIGKQTPVVQLPGPNPVTAFLRTAKPQHAGYTPPSAGGPASRNKDQIHRCLWSSAGDE